MPLRPLTGGLLLLGVLCLLVPRSALAQVTSPDQLCAPEADPCIVSSAQTIADNTELDFGSRVLRITSTGRLNSTAGNLVLDARELQLEAGGQINLAGSTSVSGGSLSLNIDEFANVAGTINLNGQDGGFLGVEAMRFDISSTATVLLNALASTGSGGTLDITCDELNINGRLQMKGGGDGAGGTATLQIATTAIVRGVFEVTAGDGGSIDLDCGANITISDTAAIRADASGEGTGGDLSIVAGDLTLGDGEGMGVLVLQGTVSSAGGGTTEGGGDGGSIDISVGNDCLVTGRLLSVGGPGATGGDIALSCSEEGIGDMTMSAEIDVHGNGTDGGGGSVDLATQAGSITVSNKINANGGTSGGGIVTVSASNNISLSDRINVNSAGAGGGFVTMSALGPEDARITLTASGSINADGSGPEGDGGNISLESCTTRVDLRTGGGQSATTNGVVGSGSINLIGVNRVSIGGKIMSGGDILLVYRDFDPFIESTAVLQPAPALIINSSLIGCGTPQPTRTPTLTPTVPTPTPTFTRPILTSTPTRTQTATPTGPTVTPTPRPTPAGPDDANCNGILENDETPGVIEGTYDVSFFAICSNSDANGDGRVNAADLPSIILKRTAPPPQ